MYIYIYIYIYTYIVRVPTCHCRLTARKLLSAIFSPTTSVVVTIIAESDPRIVVEIIPAPSPSVLEASLRMLRQRHYLHH